MWSGNGTQVVDQEGLTEIAEALSKLSQKTLLASLRRLNALPDDLDEQDIAELRRIYQDVVLRMGLKRMVSKLKTSAAKEILITVPLAFKEEDDPRSILENYVLNAGTHTLLDKLPTELLRKICVSMRLQQDMEDDEMRRMIADEVILVGAEKVLNQLNEELLSEYIDQLHIQPKAQLQHKEEMVEMYPTEERN